MGKDLGTYHLRIELEDGRGSKDTESNKRPCPFCGISLLEVITKPDWSHAGPMIYFLVRCHRCRCEGPLEENEEDAIEHWNHRVVNRKK